MYKIYIRHRYLSFSCEDGYKQQKKKKPIMDFFFSWSG